MLEILEHIPRLGLVSEATPVTASSELARALGVRSLHIKRDDLVLDLNGGTKVRKIDYLLAAPALANASRWHAVGGIGSSHLVAMTSAATHFGKRLDAHCFWEPLTAGILDNLAYTASGPTQLHYYPTRRGLALRRPALLWRESLGGNPVVPPGGTNATGMLGIVRAGLELAEQIRTGLVPAPERIYVALGTGGTAVGLSVGLALAGVRTRICAVAVVEWMFATSRRLRGLTAALLKFLGNAGCKNAVHLTPVPIIIDRSQLGRAYADPTLNALAACEIVGQEGITLEPVYTGKVFAAVLAHAASRPLTDVLVWHSAHRRPLPRAPHWRRNLPAPLARRLDRPGAGRRTRRALILGGTAAAALLGWRRVGVYPPLPAWKGKVLSAREALIFSAAAEALLPAAPVAAALAAVPVNVDRYLEAMPQAIQRDIHLMLALVEHGTALGLHVPRFTHLSPVERDSFLISLNSRGGLLAQAYRGLRDLCLLGYYQEAATWSALEYEGPRIPGLSSPDAKMRWPSYEALRAPGNSLPRGVTR